MKLTRTEIATRISEVKEKMEKLDAETALSLQKREEEIQGLAQQHATRVQELQQYQVQQVLAKNFLRGSLDVLNELFEEAEDA